MATSFLKVSNFSSHRVKFVRGMTEEMQQIIDKSRIVLDQVPAPPAMTLNVVHLLHMATSFLKVSNFSSHRVKFVRGMTEEMQQIIDESRIVLDQVPAPPAMILDVVRPSRDQIQEELRRCHKQLPPDESGEDTSQDATSQLGKAYLNEDVFLKQRVTI